MEIKKIAKKSDVRAFLSGPMTGYEDFNFKHFNDISAKLAELGVEHVNPVDICKKYKKEDVLAGGCEFKQMVQEQQDLEETCNTIILLKGWEKSVGVRLELDTAIRLGMKIVQEDDIWNLSRKCAVATSDLSDEDTKTQLARGYPDIPKGSVVKIIQEDYYNLYGGPWVRVEWNGNWYWTTPAGLDRETVS